MKNAIIGMRQTHTGLHATLTVPLSVSHSMHAPATAGMPPHTRTRMQFNSPSRTMLNSVCDWVIGMRR